MAGKPAKISLWWYAKTPQGWRHFPCVFEQKHGHIQPKHGWVRYKGQEVEYSVGRYELRTFVDGRRVYQPVESCHPLVAYQALNRARRAANGDPSQNKLHLMRSAADAYVKDCELRGAMEAAEQARLVLKEFIPLCAPLNSTRGITREHIFRFHKELRKGGNGPRTIANKHNRLKSWLKFCKVDVSFMPPTPKYEETLPTVYRPEEIRSIRQAAQNDTYMALMIDMALKLGLREQELMHAEWEDIDKHHATFRVQGKVRKDWSFVVKDKEQRDVPMPADLLESLKAWKEQRKGTTLILGNEDDQPEGHLLRKLKTLARNAKLNCGRCEGCQRKGALQECEEWTLHRFRRTYLTTLLRNGLDVKTVQHYAGHSDLASTMRYLRPAAASEMQHKVNAIRWE